MHNEKFFIEDFSEESRKLRDFEIDDVRKGHLNFTKALIDDGTSGGQNAVPEFFDTDLIVLPILDKENIAQYVNMIDVARGSAAQGATIGNPTLAAANTEGSAVGLFSTASLVAAHDTTF